MNRLKELRKKNKISQKKLSEIFKVTEKTISRWENEEVQIKKDVAQELAKYFTVSVPYLLGFDEILTNESIVDLLKAKSETEKEEYKLKQKEFVESEKYQELLALDIHSQLEVAKIMKGQIEKILSDLTSSFGVKSESNKLTRQDLKLISKINNFYDNSYNYYRIEKDNTNELLKIIEITENIKNMNKN